MSKVTKDVQEVKKEFVSGASRLSALSISLSLSGEERKREKVREDMSLSSPFSYFSFADMIDDSCKGIA